MPFFNIAQDLYLPMFKADNIITVLKLELHYKVHSIHSGIFGN